MIELQSIVSQRQMAVHATSALTTSINEANKAVAGNIGRGGGAPPVCKLCAARAQQP